jgi:pimeloyl-ACP methyl ester carboxylesterase
MKRRNILAMGAAGLAAGAGVASAHAPRRRGKAKGATFVLVHGAWHGGWCWRDVRALLEAEGARVFTPTMTGVGERAHLREPVANLSTHIADIVGVIDAEELRDIILVGHSYGGMVITGVADRLKDRIRHIVYLDAALPRDGESMITQNPALTPEQKAGSEAQMRQLAPDGKWMAVFPPTVLGVPESNVEATAWLKRRLTPHPLASWLEPIRLVNGGAEGLARTYILCTQPVLPQSSFPVHAARIKAGEAGAGWRYREIATGHDAMVTAPDAVAALLLEAAT